MPKGTDQRLKLLYMKEIFERKSDEDHPLTIEDIRSELEKQGIEVKKNDTIIQGIEDLERFVPCAVPKRRMEILHEPRKTRYALSSDSRLFEPGEIQLLVDSVQASKFLTAAKTVELIDKLANLCSEYEAKKYRFSALSQLHCTKSDSRNVHNNLDFIRQAIEQDCQLIFYTGHHNMEKKLVPRDYQTTVSPLSLIYTNEVYYMLGWWRGRDGQGEGELRPYRVDRMMHVGLLADRRREGKEHFDPDVEQSTYTQHTFNMYNGKNCEVTMVIRSTLVDAVMDQFGPEVFITPVDKEHFRISPRVTVSPQFYGWVFGMNDKIEIISPAPVRDAMRRMLATAAARYEDHQE